MGIVQEDGQGRCPLLCTLGQPWSEGRAWSREDLGLNAGAAPAGLGDPGISSVKWGNDTPCRDAGCDQRSSANNDGWGIARQLSAWEAVSAGIHVGGVSLHLPTPCTWACFPVCPWQPHPEWSHIYSGLSPDP